MLSTIEKNHDQRIDRDLWNYLKIYLKSKSPPKADLQINLIKQPRTSTTEFISGYGLFITWYLPPILNAFLLLFGKILFLFVQKFRMSCKCSTLKVRSRTFSSHRYNLNALAVTYVVNTSFFFVRPSIKKNKITIIMNILNSNTNNEYRTYIAHIPYKYVHMRMTNYEAKVRITSTDANLQIKT